MISNAILAPMRKPAKYFSCAFSQYRSACISSNLSNVFFCDPYNSSQKGACERNHEFIRYILPKGKSFDSLNQKDVDLVFSHINSTPRKSLGFNTPYNVFKAVFGIKLLEILNIQEINKDEVHLKPSLLK